MFPIHLQRPGCNSTSLPCCLTSWSTQSLSLNPVCYLLLSYFFGWLDLSNANPFSLVPFSKAEIQPFSCSVQGDTVTFDWSERLKARTPQSASSYQHRRCQKNIIGFFSAWLQKLLWVSTRWFQKYKGMEKRHANQYVHRRITGVSTWENACSFT